MNRQVTRVAVSGLALAALSAPVVAAQAATVVSRADASAATVGIAGQGQQSGSVEATFDGSSETVSGNTSPSLAVPAGGFVGLGVLTQQATARNGFSAACAGVAGNGGGTVQIGEGSCLTPGDTVDGSLGGLRLGSLLDADAAGTPGLPTDLPSLPIGDLTAQVDALLDGILGPIQTQLGNPGLVLRLDDVEGRCTVEDGSPSGSASIANASLVVQGAGQAIKLVDLPANPAPNTRVVTNLSAVVDVVLGAVETQLTEGLSGATGPLTALTGPVREQIVSGIRDNLEQQLAPLEQNVISVVLNEQSRPTSDSIEVTALHAEVLPVAREQLGAAAVDVRLGSVGCGPAGRVTAGEEPTPQAAPPASKPRIPTAVSAGTAGDGDARGLLPLAVLGLGGAAIAGTGWSAMRRRAALRG